MNGLHLRLLLNGLHLGLLLNGLQLRVLLNLLDMRLLLNRLDMRLLVNRLDLRLIPIFWSLLGVHHPNPLLWGRHIGPKLRVRKIGWRVVHWPIAETTLLFLKFYPSYFPY